MSNKRLSYDEYYILSKNSRYWHIPFSKTHIGQPLLNCKTSLNNTHLEVNMKCHLHLQPTALQYAVIISKTEYDDVT